MRKQLEIQFTNDSLGMLKELGGYYLCPRAPDGKRLGPVVGYAGTYDTPEGAKQYVGDVYANYALAERWGSVRTHFITMLLQQNGNEMQLREVDSYFAAPMGGMYWTPTLGDLTGRTVGFLEKKITALATATSREESKLIMGRHVAEPGEHISLVEDVCNNFSTTLKAAQLFDAVGARLTSVICLLNRSERDVFRVGDRDVPVIALVHKHLPQYRQDDPAVAEDVARGNVIWKPKDHWPVLMEAMAKAA